MPSVQILPQDRPFDFRQVQQMNQSISNLFQTVENQRIKNEERNIANIIANTDPISATGQPKSPFEINQEIKSKIDLSRKQRGKPGLFGIFDTTAVPSTPTPTERALTAQGISSLFGAQEEARALEDRELKRRLTEAQIGATEALAQERRADATGGFDTLTPSTQTSIINSLTDITNKSLSNIIGKPVSISDRTRKGTGTEAMATLDTQPFEVYTDVYNHVRGLNINKEDQDAILESYRTRLLAQNADEVEQFHDMLDRGVDLNALKQNNLNATDNFSDTFIQARQDAKGVRTVSELANLKKDPGKMDELKLSLARSMDAFNDDNILAVRENILDNEKLSDADVNFILDNILGTPLSFEDEKAEEEIINKSSNPEAFEKALNAILAEALRTSKDDEEYRKDYRDIIEALKISESVDTTLNQIQAQL